MNSTLFPSLESVHFTISWKEKKDPEQNQCVTISMWCSAQCSGGGCPDETWLLAVLSPVKQHHQWPITRSCTRPWRSKPQGLSVSVKPLFTLTYINVTDVQKCRNVALFFFHPAICCLFLPQTFLADNIFKFLFLFCTAGDKSTPPSPLIYCLLKRKIGVRNK